jgi:hypothetical protein
VVDERRDDSRVELRARAARELGDGLLVAQAVAVAAVRRHRVVGVAGETSPSPSAAATILAISTTTAECSPV